MRYLNLYFLSVFGWNRQTGRVDKGCLFIEQFLKKKRKKTNQTFLVINVKSFLDEVCSQEKAAGYTSHPMEDMLLGWGTQALCQAQGAALLWPTDVPAAPQPHLQATQTQHTVFTGHRPQIPTSQCSLPPKHRPRAFRKEIKPPTNRTRPKDWKETPRFLLQ